MGHQHVAVRRECNGEMTTATVDLSGSPARPTPSGKALWWWEDGAPGSGLWKFTRQPLAGSLEAAHTAGTGQISEKVGGKDYSFDLAAKTGILIIIWK